MSQRHKMHARCLHTLCSCAVMLAGGLLPEGLPGAAAEWRYAVGRPRLFRCQASPRDDSRTYTRSALCKRKVRGWVHNPFHCLVSAVAVAVLREPSNHHVPTNSTSLRRNTTKSAMPKARRGQGLEHKHVRKLHCGFSEHCCKNSNDMTS